MLKVKSQAQQKIIDMHVHSYDIKHFSMQVKDYYGTNGSVNADKHFNETYKIRIEDTV